MTQGIVLHITAAGRRQRTDARLNGTPLPRFSGWIVDSAVTQDPENPTLEPLYTSNNPEETLIERLDDTAIAVHIVIPAGFAGWVRGLALKTEDGTVYAYCRYAESQGGLYKTDAMAIRQQLILAEDGRESVEFTYAVVSVDYLLKQVEEGLQAPLLYAIDAVAGVGQLTHMRQTVALIDMQAQQQQQQQQMDDIQIAIERVAIALAQIAAVGQLLHGHQSEAVARLQARIDAQGALQSDNRDGLDWLMRALDVHTGIDQLQAMRSVTNTNELQAATASIGTWSQLFDQSAGLNQVNYMNCVKRIQKLEDNNVY